MYKLLISLVLLSVTAAMAAESLDSVGGAGHRRGHPTAHVQRQSGRPAEDNLKCVEPATRVNGFPFCTTRSVLRWHEAPAQRARPPISVDHGRSI